MNKYTVIIILGALGIAAFILWLRPDSDITSVFTSIVSGVVLLLTYLKVNEMGAKVDEVKAVAEETHKSVNSRLDAMLLNAASAAREEGRAAGRKEGEDRVDVLSAEKFEREQGQKPKP